VEGVFEEGIMTAALVDGYFSGLGDGYFLLAMATKRARYTNMMNCVPLQVILILLAKLVSKMVDISMLNHCICRHNEPNCALNYSS
jgi:hypothetical protein